jgi:hypothetical protein
MKRHTILMKRHTILMKRHPIFMKIDHLILVEKIMRAEGKGRRGE